MLKLLVFQSNLDFERLESQLGILAKVRVAGMKALHIRGHHGFLCRLPSVATSNSGSKSILTPEFVRHLKCIMIKFSSFGKVNGR